MAENNCGHLSNPFKNVEILIKLRLVLQDFATKLNYFFACNVSNYHTNLYVYIICNNKDEIAVWTDCLQMTGSCDSFLHQNPIGSYAMKRISKLINILERFREKQESSSMKRISIYTNHLKKIGDDFVQEVTKQQCFRDGMHGNTTANPFSRKRQAQTDQDCLEMASITKRTATSTES